MIFSRKKSRRGGVVPRRRAEGRDDVRSSIEMPPQFRRNQTLSGIRRETSEQPSERSRAHHLAQQRRKISGILLLVVGGIIVLTLLLTQFTAKVIVAASSEPLSQAIEGTPYEAAINDYFGIHPVERLRFVLNEDGLSEYVAVLTPEVSRVELTSSTNMVESNFTITFRKPVAGWQINGKQYYVDSTGVVFDKNYYDKPSVQIVDESGVSPEQGSTVASARLLSFVGRVVSQSREEGYAVTRAVLPVGSTRQVEIRLKGVRPYVKLTIDRAAGEQVQDMTRTLDYLRDERVSAQYVDVRVAGRAAYR
jgi:hypothetical protein